MRRVSGTCWFFLGIGFEVSDSQLELMSFLMHKAPLQFEDRSFSRQRHWLRSDGKFSMEILANSLGIGNFLINLLFMNLQLCLSLETSYATSDYSRNNQDQGFRLVILSPMNLVSLSCWGHQLIIAQKIQRLIFIPAQKLRFCASFFFVFVKFIAKSIAQISMAVQ